MIIDLHKFIGEIAFKIRHLIGDIAVVGNIVRLTGNRRRFACDFVV